MLIITKDGSSSIVSFLLDNQDTAQISNKTTTQIKNIKKIMTEIHKFIFQKQESYCSLRILRFLVFKQKFTTTYGNQI